MDKYLSRALDNYGIGICFANKAKQSVNTFEKNSVAEFKLPIKQDEDINIVNYQILIFETGDYTPLESVQVFKGGKWTALKQLKKADGFEWYDKVQRLIDHEKKLFVVDVDFNNRIEKVKLVFNNNFVDPIEFELVYAESSKEAYYKKVAEQNRQSLINAAQIKLATGADLVNIYFQPCSEKCAKTVVELYSTMGGKMLLGKFTVEEGMFFKSITGLAHGSYEVKVSQFDKENKEIFTSDPFPFVLGTPHGGRHTVVI